MHIWDDFLTYQRGVPLKSNLLLEEMWQLQDAQALTGVQKFSHAQVADGESHYGGLVQTGGDAVGQGQFLSQLVEHLRLLAAPTSRGISGLLLSPLWTHPARDERWVSERAAVNRFRSHDTHEERHPSVLRAHWGRSAAGLPVGVCSKQPSVSHSDTFTSMAVCHHFIGRCPNERSPPPWSDWLAGEARLLLSLGARPNCSATQITVTFMRLAQQIPREEDDNTGTDRQLPDKHHIYYCATLAYPIALHLNQA